MSTIVVNMYDKDRTERAYDKYMGRGGSWGNPFVIGRDGNRDEVCDKHDKWFRKQQHLIDRLKELEGKRLGCFCKPKRCHVDNIIRVMKELGYSV